MTLSSRRTRFAGLAALLALVVAQGTLLPGAAQAVTGDVYLTVSTTDDVSPTTGACGDPAITTAPSTLSLREATCLANNLAYRTFVTLPAGHYDLTYGELRLGTTTGSTFVLTGAGAENTVIDAQGRSRVLHLDVDRTGYDYTSISGVTITGGQDDTAGGAGILAGSGSGQLPGWLYLIDCVLTDNHANTGGSTATDRPGGALQFVGGSLTLQNTVVSDNSSGDSPGSGVMYDALGSADYGFDSELRVVGSTFSRNSLTSGPGVTNGGALAVRTDPSTSRMFPYLSDTKFVDNTATADGGAVVGVGVWVRGGGMLLIMTDTFTRNSATGSDTSTGGAIGVTDDARVSTEFNRYSGNTAAAGSAVSATGTGSVVSYDDWWGCNGGPGASGCETVSGAVTADRWLTLTAASSPRTLQGPEATSTVTASLQTDSAGEFVDGGGLRAFEGAPVSWSAPQPGDAAVDASSSAISAGVATVGYDSHTGTGEGGVSATLDNATVQAPITVEGAPAITSADQATFTHGSAGSFTITTSGFPAPTLTQSGTLPAGMSFDDNGDGTATLSGTPTATGSYSLPVTAANGVDPDATQTLTVVVGQAPAFTSPATGTFTAGSAGSFTVTTTGSPAPTLTQVSGTLPAGLTFTDNGDGTATVSGTPADDTTGDHDVVLGAANGHGAAATQTLTVRVEHRPVVTTQPASQEVLPGASATFHAGASGTPTPTVQWQRSTDGGGSYTDIADATTDAYTVTASAADTGDRYRAVFTNDAGTATSDAATLTVASAPPTGSAPTIDSADATTFTVGARHVFTVTTHGSPRPALTTAGTLPGWVDFTDNGDGTGTLSGTAPSGSAGTAHFTLLAGNGVDPSASQAFTLTVARVAQTITASSTPPGSATVGSSYRPAGTSDSGLDVGYSVDPATTSSACSLSGATVSLDHAGTCVVDFDQAGDGTFSAAPTVRQTFTVSTVATGLRLTSSRPSSTYGEAVRVTGNVSAASGSSAGRVQFRVDGVDLGAPVAVDATHPATVDLTSAAGRPLAPGAHAVTARFTPTDATAYAGSTGALTQTVEQSATTSVLSVRPTTLASRVTATTPGAGTPTGRVTFTVAGASVGTAPLVDGTATLTYTTRPGLTRQVTASYGGDGDFTGSSVSTARHDPRITAVVSSPRRPTRAHWYRTPVTVTFRCAEDGSPLVGHCPAPVHFNKGGAGRSVTRTITAADGGAATAVVSGINIDRAGPWCTSPASVTAPSTTAPRRRPVASPRTTCPVLRAASCRGAAAARSRRSVPPPPTGPATCPRW